MKVRFTFTLIILSAFLLHAQEMLVPLQSNPVVSRHFNQTIRHRIKPAASSLSNDTLPFLDDFSKPGPYPDSSKWIEHSVYINRTFPIAPPSIGVATFDGLDSSGYPYNFSAGPTTAAPADLLTSRPIKMPVAGGPQDSNLFFSFFYQAQGTGIYPKTDDSLVLEFRSPITKTWNWIWSHQGYYPQYPDTGFHLVMIHIIDSSYFHDGFQFRFRNYACPCGNVDHWNLDYVYLNTGRSYADTIFQDLAFVYNPSSLLKNYQAMPWRQYKISELRDSMATWISYNGNSVISGTYNYEIFDNATPTVPLLPLYTPNSFNFYPFKTNGYSNYPLFAHPPLVDQIPLLSDSAVYTWKSYFVNNAGDLDLSNDTVSSFQVFSDFYAYDDGSAEQAYYLQSQPAFNPSFCMRFNLNTADTLRAISMFFNPVVTNASLFPFKLAVWNDKGGMPGKQVYTDTVNEYPDYFHGAYNEFTEYRMRKDTNFILQPGNWYFGFIQDNSTTNQDPLNIGFDVNTNASANTWINVSGFWQQSTLAGTVMLRPLFGVNRSLTAIENSKAPELNFAVYPNPVSGSLSLLLPPSDGVQKFNLRVLDAFGNLVFSQNDFSSTSIDCSGLAQGVYFIRLSDQYFNSSVKRVVIIH